MAIIGTGTGPSVPGGAYGSPPANRYQEWLNRFQSLPAYDMADVTANLPANASDEDVAAVMMTRMMNQSGASRYLSPMARARMEDSTEAAMQSDVLTRTGRQAMANMDYVRGGRSDNALEVPMRTPEDIQGILRNRITTGNRLPAAEAGRYMTAINDLLAYGSQSDANLANVDALYKMLTAKGTGPAMQQQIAQGMASGLGYGGIYGNYLRNQNAEAWKNYLAAGQQAGPSFLAYLNWGPWMQGR